MNIYKYVIVILVYRNVMDLHECIKSIQNKISSYKVIVVNSFYDEESYMQIEKTANEYNCEFLNVENRGYSYGNNCGIRLALEQYQFEYLIVANPDTIVEKFDDRKINNYDVIAPNIVDLKGQKQNPASVIFNPFTAKLTYMGFKKNAKFLILVSIGVNKIVREAFLLLIFCIPKKEWKIYKAHGSFILLKKQVLDRLFPLYDDAMFMFAEEDVVAYRLKKEKIITHYCEDIKVLHKEDGSIKKSNLNMEAELRKSCMYFYEHYL